MSLLISGSRIELLTKQNYDSWRIHAEALLVKSELWEYVSGEKPIPGGDITQPAVLEAQDKWRRYDRKARAELVLLVHPKELQQIRGCETSRQIWEKLESVYASKGPARKAIFLKQLALSRMPEGGDVREHLDKFFDAIDKLSAMDIQVNADMAAILLLYSLPSSYENFRCAIESRDELPSPETLKVKVIE